MGDTEDTDPGIVAGTLERLTGLWRKWQSIPMLLQINANDCGPTCLAMVLGYLGKSIRVERIREVLSTDNDGVNARILLDAARVFGLRGRGLSVPLDQLDALPRATILHWNFTHFVVFDSVLRDGRVRIADPATGWRTLTQDEVSKHFTGVALVFEPTDEFEGIQADTARAWFYIKNVLAERSLWWRILVMSLFLQLLSWVLPGLTGLVVDTLVPRGDVSLFAVVATGVAGLVVFQTALIYVREQLLLYLRMRLDARLMVSLMEWFSRLALPFFQRRSSGELVQRLQSARQIRESLSAALLSSALDGTTGIGAFVILAFASGPIFLMALFWALVDVVLLLAGHKKLLRMWQGDVELSTKTYDRAYDLISGMHSFKSAGAELRGVEDWTNVYIQFANASLKRGQAEVIFSTLRTGVMVAGPISVLCVGAYLTIQNQLTLGQMLALQTLAVNFLSPLSQLVSSLMGLGMMTVHAARVDEVFAQPPEQDLNKNHKRLKLKGGVRFENLRFRYGPLSPHVLHGVSGEINPGQFVAIVGTSGSGKSTLGNVLLGLLMPEEGNVYFDGCPLIDLDLSYTRRQLGVVLQHGHIMQRNVMHNITLFDESITRGEVEEAGKMACVHDDIMKMPLGYDSLLAEDGLSLSGGQRQRLFLARALVRQPTIVFLDEATSALDTVTESAVYKNLTQLRCTRIVVAHRLSTVRDADQIWVMDEGLMVERGTHDQLVAQNGYYANLVKAQLGGRR